MSSHMGSGIWGSVLLLTVLTFGIASPEVGPPPALASSDDSSLPESNNGGVSGMAGGAGLELLPSDPWTPPWLSLEPLAAFWGSGETGGARKPLWSGFPDLAAGDAPLLQLSAGPGVSLSESAEMAEPSADIPGDVLGEAPAVDPAPPPAFQTLQAAAPDPQDQPAANIQISGVLMYRLFNDPYPPVAGDGNLNALSVYPLVGSGERHHDDNDGWASAGLDIRGQISCAARDDEPDSAFPV